MASCFVALVKLDIDAFSLIIYTKSLTIYLLNYLRHLLASCGERNSLTRVSARYYAHKPRAFRNSFMS